MRERRIEREVDFIETDPSSGTPFSKIHLKNTESIVAREISVGTVVPFLLKFKSALTVFVREGGGLRRASSKTQPRGP